MNKRYFIWALAFAMVFVAGCSDNDDDGSTAGTSSVFTNNALEAESGTGDGRLVQRSSASGGQAIRLRSGEVRFINTSMPTGKFWVRVRYSNAEVENHGKLERIDVSLNSIPVGFFHVGYTGSGDGGWNAFSTSVEVGPGPFHHGGFLQISIAANDGDGAGVEIDQVQIIQ